MESHTTTTPVSQPQSPSEAVDAVRAHLRQVETELVALGRCNGRVLAQDIHADRDSPALDVSAMDGFAASMVDIPSMAGPPGVPVGGLEAMIGQAPIQMPRGRAVRIVTGAPIPLGAEVVVRHEDVELNNGDARLKVEAGIIKGGANIRRRGENAKRGEIVARSGALITAATIGALASFGVAQVSVHRRVRVALVATGDELVKGSDGARPWQIRDSNGPVLESLLGARGWIEIVSRANAPDDRESLSRVLESALESSDAVVLTGGVSMGHKDFVPQVVERLGARTIFHKLPQRPGGPMLAAVLPAMSGPRLILGLPGNPVSVMVTARRIGLELLGAQAGLSPGQCAGHSRSIANMDNAVLQMWWYRLVGQRVNARGDSELYLLSNKGSGDIAAAASSVGFVEVPPGHATGMALNYYDWMH